MATETYEAAAQGRRLRHWRSPSVGPNEAIRFALDTLRNRSRDQVRQNAYASRASDAWVTNLVGTGIRPLSKAPAERDFRERLHALWGDWQEEADAAGELDFYGLQAQIARAWFEGGECFVRRRLRPPSDGLTVPLQLQVLESEHLPIAMHEMPNGAQAAEGNVIRYGIEFDPMGRRVAYHMRRSHPGEQDRFLKPDDVAALETERIPAEEILHIYVPSRPGQKRGEPALTQALISLRDIDAWNDAELTRQKMARMFVGFVTKQGPTDKITVGTQDEQAKPDPVDVDTQTLEPGSMLELNEGESINWTEPPQIGDDYVVFLRSQLRAVAQSVGVLYEQLTGDYSQINDRTYRASHNELKRQVDQLQQGTLVPMLCRPVWRWFWDTARAAGQLRRPRELNDEQARRAVWIAPGWRHLHPVQEEQAQRAAVRSGFKSRAEVVSERGGDPVEVDSQLAEERQRAQQLELAMDTDPAQVTQLGMAQGEQTGFDFELEEEDATEG